MSSANSCEYEKNRTIFYKYGTHKSCMDGRTHISDTLVLKANSLNVSG